MSSPPRTRADRLHLLHRVDTARRAATLLRSKEEALEREQDRVAGHLARATSDWAAALGTATSLLARARALGASGELDRWVRTLPATATAAPTWQVSMGVSYPTAVACTPGPRPDLTTTAALGPAADAYAAALSAAATAAGAALAQRRLDRELAETRRRRRAVEDRLLPELEDTCRRLELHLDELDREEAQRVRTAVRIREGGTMIGRILLAVDDSAPAFAAADLAIELAQTLAAKLRAVTVAEEGHLPDRVLGAVASRARRAGVRVETVTLADGMPPFELTLAEADRWGADLVVMGRSDQRRLGPAYVGSQTSRLLEFAEIPVLVVPGPAPG